MEWKKTSILQQQQQQQKHFAEALFGKKEKNHRISVL